MRALLPAPASCKLHNSCCSPETVPFLGRIRPCLLPVACSTEHGLSFSSPFFSSFVTLSSDLGVKSNFSLGVAGWEAAPRAIRVGGGDLLHPPSARMPLQAQGLCAHPPRWDSVYQQAGTGDSSWAEWGAGGGWARSGSSLPSITPHVRGETNQGLRRTVSPQAICRPAPLISVVEWRGGPHIHTQAPFYTPGKGLGLGMMVGGHPVWAGLVPDRGWLHPVLRQVRPLLASVSPPIRRGPQARSRVCLALWDVNRFESQFLCL